MKVTTALLVGLAFLIPQYGGAEAGGEVLKSGKDVDVAIRRLWSDHVETYRESGDFKALGELPAAWSIDPPKGTKIEAKLVQCGEHFMPFVVLNKSPEEGRKSPLYICLHGGGQSSDADGPHSWPVNTREWHAQMNLAASQYPGHGVFFVPRMADDRLGRWYHDLNVDVFDRVIEHAIMAWNVDPNRVYLLGISEGGYGTDALLPYMADRFAAGNSMAAGSLSKVGAWASAENLRDTPMRTDIGGNDTMFNRIGMARELHQVLDGFEEKNPGHYKHLIKIHEGMGHGGWDYGSGPAWLGQFERDPQPSKVVWVMSPVQREVRRHYYWLGLPGGDVPRHCRIQAVADREANVVTISAEAHSEESGKPGPLKGTPLEVCLNDRLVDLDRPFTVIINGKTVHNGRAPRTIGSIKQSLERKGDPTQVYPVILMFELE